MDKRSSRDFVSDLPLGIIHMILARVPIRDAVKTSTLSRSWRYKWASLPELVFDNECVSHVEHDTRLKRFIHQVLVLHEGPIQKFKLDLVTMKRCSYTDQWLILCRKDIRTLILDMDQYGGAYFVVHSSLYSCQNLTHLELFECEIPRPPPTFKGYLCLRCLVLGRVLIPSDALESLVDNSPLLEELTLDHVELWTLNENHRRIYHLELRISAPNLKCFYFRGVCSDICLYAPLLAKLSVFLRDYDYTNGRLQQDPVCNYTKFLGRFTNLEELSGNLHFMKYLSIGIESCQTSLMLPHLRLMEIRPMNLADKKLKSVFAHLIMGAPNLHKLSIVSLSFRVRGPIFTFERLKVIEMENVCGEPQEMRFMRFLLERSPVLETMILKPFPYLTGEQLVNMMAEVLSFRPASTNAEILFSKKMKASSSLHE